MLMQYADKDRQVELKVRQASGLVFKDCKGIVLA